MSVPMLVLTAGASLGVGVVAAPFAASLLSKPITGEVVPTRLTDLAGYLTASGGKGLGFEDDTLEQSIGDVAPGVGASTPVQPLPKPKGTPAPTTATADSKRVLAVASLAVGAALALTSFLLMRRAFK